MIQQVRHTLRQHMPHLGRGPIWVAVSGGVDSMVLWHVLRELGVQCRVVHVDHGLRGPESDADRELVVAHGRAWGDEVHVHRVDVRGAERAGRSVQMAARAARYEVFHACVQQGPGTLAMAHHADDAVETFLMHLLRGMGLQGWAGIPPVAGPFVRPLMGVRRAEVEAYARTHAIPFRNDASNADPHYLRNRVRHELIPMLEALRPGAGDVLVRNVGWGRELSALAGQAIAPDQIAFAPDAEGVSRLPIERITASAAPRLLLHALLGPKGFHPDMLDRLGQALAERRTGAVFLHGPWRAVVDRDALVLGPIPGEARSWTIAAPDDVPADAPIRITPCDAALPPTDPHIACLDPAQVVFPLVLRPWRPGDRMRPAGMSGHKLVSDILTDARVPAHRRPHTMVLESDHRIIWVCGVRLAEGVKARVDRGRHLRLEWRVQPSG